MGIIGAFISGPKAVLKYLRYNTAPNFRKKLAFDDRGGMLKRMEW